MATLVYAGIRLAAGNKKIYTYFKPETEGHASFDKPLVAGSGYIGAIIESEVSEDGKTYSKSKLVRSTKDSDPWNNDEQLGYWHIADRVAKDTLQKFADIKKFEGDPINECIETLRRRLNVMTSPKEKNRIARYVFEQLLK